MRLGSLTAPSFVESEAARRPHVVEQQDRAREKFFHEVITNPVPIDLNTLRAMKRSPLGLDLYLWLTYRTFELKRPLRLTWPVLYRQFGVDPARANDKATLSNFRADCLRELKKIKDAWPDLHYQTVKGSLLLSPSAAAHRAVATAARE